MTGTFTWQEPSAKPVVADSNVTEYTVVFTPSDTANYNPVEAKVTLTVNKAQNAPNMPGSTMDVSNSLEKVGDVSLPEGWEWQASDQDTALEVGKTVSAVAVYAGADKGNYENETVTVAITRSACDHVAGRESAYLHGGRARAQGMHEVRLCSGIRYCGKGAGTHGRNGNLFQKGSLHQVRPALWRYGRQCAWRYGSPWVYGGNLYRRRLHRGHLL